MLFEETSKILQTLISTYSSFLRIAEVVQLFIGNYIWVRYMKGKGKIQFCSV